MPIVLCSCCTIHLARFLQNTIEWQARIRYTNQRSFKNNNNNISMSKNTKRTHKYKCDTKEKNVQTNNPNICEGKPPLSVGNACEAAQDGSKQVKEMCNSRVTPRMSTVFWFILSYETLRCNLLIWTYLKRTKKKKNKRNIKVCVCVCV